MAALAVIALFGCAPGPLLPAPTPPGPTLTGSPAATPPGDASAQSVVAALFATALSGDRAAFDDQVSDRDPAFADRARLIYDNIQALPWAQLDASAGRGAQWLVGSRQTLLGADAWVQPVTLRWRLDGDDAVAEHVVWLTFVRQDGRPRVAGTRDGPAEPARQPSWWLGPVRGQQRGSATVLVGAGQSPERWLAAAEQAVRAVRQHLPTTSADAVGSSVVLEVPATIGDFEAVVGATPGSYADVAAVTFAEGPTAEAALRVVVNPAAAQRLTADGLAVTLAHETVHVVTRSPRSPAPLWATEGLADYVALQAYPRAADAVAEPLLADVRAHGAPDRLPVDTAFDDGAERLGLAYAQSWFACRSIAESTSPAALGRFYRALDRGRTLDQAATDELGRSGAEVTRGWRRYLVAAAR